MKYVITQNRVMEQIAAPVRCSASIRELAFAAFTWDQAPAKHQPYVDAT